MTVVNPKSISGINSITTGSGSDNLLTIHTSDASNTERLRIDSTGATKIVTGIVTTLTATTGIVTTLTANTVTSLGAVSGTTGTFSAAVSGTTGTFTGDVDIADKIVHTGDTDTAIRFSGADTITAETGGTARVSIDSSGRLLLGAGAIATPKSSGAGGLDLDNGTISLVVGGNENSTGRTDGTSKINRIAVPHRTNSEEPVAMFSCQASTSTNTLFYGGGSSYTNAVTEHKFYTAADTTTTTGTQRLRIRSNGELQVGVLDTPSASRGAFGIKASNDAQSVGINLYLQEVSGGEGYGIGVDGDGDLNFYNGGATSPTLEILDNNNVEVTDGDLVIGTSGHGISFAATGDGLESMSNELLDDYEEGTFTPTAANFTIAVTYSANYTKIGNVVYVQMYITAASGSGTGAVSIGGMPYAAKGSNYYSYACGRIGGGTNAQNDIVFQFNQNNTTAIPFINDGNINESMISAQHLIMSGFYQV